MKAKLLILAALLPIVASATSFKEDISENYVYSQSQYMLYPEPDGVSYTKAPKGYKPFYISTYMRHGSRWLIDESSYTGPQKVLQVADSLGLLTPTGKVFKTAIDSLVVLSNNRLGELTSVGFKQHQGIAERMYKNFPEIFKGNVHVDARSTYVIRCILSMAAECTTLISLNHNIQLFTDASWADMYYMNDHHSPYAKYVDLQTVKDAKLNFKNKVIKPELITNLLFTDFEPLKEVTSADDICNKIVEITTWTQNIEEADFNNLISYIPTEALYGHAARGAFNWYTSAGYYPLNENMAPFKQINLLNNIIDSADSAIASGKNQATLRYGHDSVLLTLVSLMHINNAAYSNVDPIKIVDNWRVYDIAPMAGNLQLIFYKSNKKGDPILVKILLNEHESTIPLKPVSGPYYKWDDVRSYYKTLLQGK